MAVPADWRCGTGQPSPQPLPPVAGGEVLGGDSEGIGTLQPQGLVQRSAKKGAQDEGLVIWYSVPYNNMVISNEQGLVLAVCYLQYPT